MKEETCKIHNNFSYFVQCKLYNSAPCSCRLSYSMQIVRKSISITNQFISILLIVFLHFPYNYIHYIQAVNCWMASDRIQSLIDSHSMNIPTWTRASISFACEKWEAFAHSSRAVEQFSLPIGRALALICQCQSVNWQSFDSINCIQTLWFSVILMAIWKIYGINTRFLWKFNFNFSYAISVFSRKKSNNRSRTNMGDVEAGEEFHVV